MKIVRRTAALALFAALLASVLPLTAGAATGPAGWHTVSYLRAIFVVPAGWPVRDLASEPTSCVRFDVHAVYIGHQGPDPACPARVIGRTEAVQAEPLDAASAAQFPFSPTATTVAGLPAFVAPGSGTSHAIVVAFPTLGVLVTLAYGADRALVGRILASVRDASGRTGLTAPVRLPAAPRGVGAPSGSGAPEQPTTFTGSGFDACTAPSTSTMTAWLASPYRSLGIYIGGSNRACTQANLSSSWVSTVEHQGWRLAPLYVGLQAPCVNHIGLQRIDPASAASQGTAAANDAIAQAHLYGLGVGPPIYFDMEGYDATDAACDLAVERFLSAWTGTLHANGYVAGVYSGAASGIPQLVKYYDSTTYNRPDDIWFAHWDLRATVFGDPFFGDQYWANHQRVHQYQGGHTETYGGVTINIDLDEVDATLNTYAGNGTIVFDTNRTGTRQVFALGADGVGVTRVTTGGYDDYAPAISPGGTRVAFTSTRSGNAEVWLQNMDGTGLKRLTFAPGFDGYPSWSPDGSKIAFQSDRTGNMDVWTIGSNGLGVHEVTFDTHVDERPSWSPSGLRIAFDSDRAGNTNIYAIPAGGGTVTELTFKAAGDRRPVYSPSGSTIAFQSTRSGNADIWLIPVSGGAVTQLTAVSGADYSASWSPDGTRIAFVSARTGQSEVFVMHADGSSVVQYTHVGTLNELPSWGN